MLGPHKQLVENFVSIAPELLLLAFLTIAFLQSGLDKILG